MKNEITFLILVAPKNNAGSRHEDDYRTVETAANGNARANAFVVDPSDARLRIAALLKEELNPRAVWGTGPNNTPIPSRAQHESAIMA